MSEPGKTQADVAGSDHYTCAECGGVFKKGWSDEEALAEQKLVFGALPPPTENAIVCDDCYNAFHARRTARIGGSA